jgi:outer membrane protein TolC
VRDPGAGSLLGPGERDSLALLAATQRAPEVTLAAVAHQQAALDASDARQRDAGTLGLTVDAGLAGTDLTRAVPAALLDTDPNATFADRLRRDLGASAALTWRLPLFDRARAPAAAARLAAANAAWARHESEIEFAQRDALSLLAQWRTAGRRLEATAIIVARAEVHYLRTKSLYAAGATTLFDLLDALQLHRDASIRLADAREEIRFLRFRAEDRP